MDRRSDILFTAILNVTKSIPNYLRVHRGPRRAPVSPVRGEQPDSDQGFWNAYTEATGWRIDQRASHPNRDNTLNLLPAVNVDTVADIDAMQSAPSVSQSSAQRLAEAAARLSQQLSETRAALRRQEAELAARAAVVVGVEDQSKLADRIESTLSMAAAACGCDAAAMYLLDDDTRLLKARAVHGLPAERLEVPARALQGSRGDLEALVQGVVTIDDLQAGSIDTWCCPEPYGAAICASINNASVPIGTMWLYSTSPREFTDAHATAARMAAAQLATELAGAVVDRRPTLRRQADQAIRDIANWQYEGLPAGTVLAEGWMVDGMIESAQPWATGWHHWDMLPDGTMVLAIAEAVEKSMSGALTATVARAALTAHLGYRHTPAQIMQRVNDTLWNTSTADQLTSLLYARVDPESGEGEIASAGSICAMVANRYGYRPLVDGRSEPLTSHIDAQFRTTTFRMTDGETLLAYGPGMMADGASQTLLGDQARGSMERGEKSPLATIRRALAKHPLEHERGALTLLKT
tara:strand:- start:1495 stop:3063 length:1569 start_codon:yes stop_codon:yes gene_type:complete